MRPRNDSGATAVEFALVVPIALTLIFVVLYLGMYYFYAATAAHVARVVARDASIPTHGVYPTAGEENDLARRTAGGLLPAPSAVDLAADPSPGEGSELTVTVTYQLPGLAVVGRLMSFLPHPSGDLHRTVTVRYE